MPRKSKYIKETKMAYRDLADVSAIESLKEEIENWKDNLEGANMEHLPKYEEVNECFEALEGGIERLESGFDDLMRLLQIENHPLMTPMSEEVTLTMNMNPRQSRSDRLSDAVSDLRVLLDKLEEFATNEDDEKKIEGLDEVISQIGDGIAELEEVSFPGMY